MKTSLRTHALALTCTTLLACGPLRAQSPNPDFQQKLDALSQQLAAAKDRLRQSQAEIDALQRELDTMRAQLPAPSTTQAANPPSSSAADAAEKLEIVEAEVKQQAQTKVESTSKYHVQISGLVLFNTFLNNGAVDQLDLPSYAQASTAGVARSAFGATLRQTMLGLTAEGPHVLGARTSADVFFDFFGGTPTEAYGTVAGVVRMRTGGVHLDWSNDSIEAGMEAPLISPLSPTSYASVAEPALSWAGNLWTWAPQLSYKHRFGPLGPGRLTFEFGLWDSPAAGYNTGTTSRTASAGERSAQPAYETRIAWSRDQRANTDFQVGMGGYYSRQSYTGRAGDSWAVTGDWQIPVTAHFQFSGELYRGRALAGLGAGLYKDVVPGTDPVTGAATFRLLNTAGGWAQAKFRMPHQVEWNSMFGLDDAFTRDFESLVPAAGYGGYNPRVRNQVIATNLIFAPKTYFVLSPEYKHIRTSPYEGSPTAADILTFSIGLRF